MKVLSQLPEQKHYKLIESTESWYRWEDKASSRVRLLSKSLNIWTSEKVIVIPRIFENKTDKSVYASRLELTVRPYNKEEEETIPTAKIIREIEKGYIANTQCPVLFFAAVSLPKLESEKVPRWLLYSLIA